LSEKRVSLEGVREREFKIKVYGFKVCDLEFMI
jgi:hypothetical protein